MGAYVHVGAYVCVSACILVGACMHSYRPTGVQNLAEAGVAKIEMPGPGLALVFNFLMNISI